MNLSMAIVVIVVLALVFFFVRRQQQPTPDNRAAKGRPLKADSTGEFHAVSIRFPSSACSAAKNIKGKRYLSSAAPRIPLPDCDVLECKCRFIHHKDRREGDDRRDHFRPGIAGETGKHERRHGPDRREDL